jgi:predicted ArsR family transcriptional regulator
MAGDHKTDVQENAARIIEWLLEHNGVEETSLGEAVGLSEHEAREAIDHLESHEDLARLPEALSNRPRFLLKPARGWSEIAERRRGEKRAGGEA